MKFGLVRRTTDALTLGIKGCNGSQLGSHSPPGPWPGSKGGAMACACGGGATQTTRNEDAEFVVRHPNGTREIVKGETQAKIAATMVGGTYSAR